MTSKTDGVDTYVYSWSEDNQLLGVSLNSSPVVSYEYDSGSRMLQRIEGSTSTNYHWDDWDLVREEKDDGVDVEVTNYLVPQGEVLAFQRDGDWFYLHGDGLSSTQLVTDESGAQVARAVYGAWGETLSSNESIPGLLETRFVGGLGVRNDPATGLIWMSHRWYDPDTQRFISRDPIGLAGATNLYSYGDNNPTTFVDPEGLSPRGGPRNTVWRARRAIQRFIRQANRAHRQRVHQNLAMLGMKNLNLQGLSLIRGSNALYRRGFVFTGMTVGHKQPTDLVREAIYFNFWNPYTRTSVVWDAGCPNNSYASTRSSHWTISRPERGDRGEWYNHRGEVVERTSREAHVYSAGFGEGTFYQVKIPFFDRNAVIPQGFPNPPLGDKPAWLEP